jgi:serine O-acetyltransferase
MLAKLELRSGTPSKLAHFVARQLDALFPDASLNEDEAAVASVIANSLERMRPILAAVRIFDPSYFDHFNSLQYASFLYLLSTEASLKGLSTLADRLFCLNKSLAGIELYHRVSLGEVFFLSHGLGSVVGNATYGNYIVFFQNVTIGRIGNNVPILGNNLILFPGCSITGQSIIGNNCVIGAKINIHNMSIPDNSIVTLSNNGTIISPLEKDYRSLYFRP